MKNTKITLSNATACLVSILLMAGGAAFFPQATPEASLEERVSDYMQAQVDQKWDRAYLFLNDSSRRQVSREKYIHQTRKASYTGFEIEEITVQPEGDQATVKVRIDILFMGFELKRTPHTQTWVKEKGTWFIVAQPKARPFDPLEKQE